MRGLERSSEHWVARQQAESLVINGAGASKARQSVPDLAVWAAM